MQIPLSCIAINYRSGGRGGAGAECRRAGGKGGAKGIGESVGRV